MRRFQLQFRRRKSVSNDRSFAWQRSHNLYPRRVSSKVYELPHIERMDPTSLKKCDVWSQKENKKENEKEIRPDRCHDVPHDHHVPAMFTGRHQQW